MNIWRTKLKDFMAAKIAIGNIKISPRVINILKIDIANSRITAQKQPMKTNKDAQ